MDPGLIRKAIIAVGLVLMAISIVSIVLMFMGYDVGFLPFLFLFFPIVIPFRGRRNESVGYSDEDWCPECGREVMPDDTFCPGCGRMLR